MERVQAEQEDDDLSTFDEDDDVSTRWNESSKKEVWFTKLAPLIDHLRKTSEEVIFTLGNVLSIDEMMIRFMGRSHQTHCIKNKPIREGFKFFVLATTNGYVVNFTPD